MSEKKSKIVGVALRPNSEYLKSEFIKLKKGFELKGWAVGIDENSAEMIGMEGNKSWEIYKKADILITLGGDGTWLSTARRSLGFGKPILGVHFGNLGFLAEISSQDLDKWIEKIDTGDYDVKERMVLQTVIDGPDYSRKLLSVNEIVIKSKTVGFTHVKFYIDGKYVNGYHGDGLIVSTPTGSTAYNLSAGGPIVYPYSENIILSPISSHSLSQRPLVLPANIKNMELRLDKDEGNNILVSDGQEEIEINNKMTIKIEKANNSVLVITDKDKDFFGVLREKLMWGDHR